MPATKRIRPAVVRDPLLTIADLALKWGWSDQKIRRLVDARQIPHYRIGDRRHNTIHFRESEVEQWLKDLHVQPAAAIAEEANVSVDRGEECRRLNLPVDHEFS